MSKVLKISEIFKSFQGEGPLIGRLAIFLRLSGCNLRCIWCDTKYAYYPKYVLDISKVFKMLLKLRESTCQDKPLLVITGGEPLLQKDSLKELLPMFRNYFTIQLETNGTIDPEDLLDYVDYIVVSPKLENSKNPKDIRKICEKYRYIIRSYRCRIFFKFVIENYEDIYEVNSIVREFNINNENVYLMPQCSNFDDCVKKMKIVYTLALRYGYSISPRLQYIVGFR